MDNFQLCFNSEYPDIGSFRQFIQISLQTHRLAECYDVEFIINWACRLCETPTSADAAVDIHLAWLKTTCLEIIQELSQSHNKKKFNQAVQALFDENNPDALSFCASITRMLRQFRLLGTYEAREIIAEAYTRGIKKIEAGVFIEIPLAWLRKTCLYVISEFKQKQIKSSHPKLDQEAWSSGNVVFSEILLQEDVEAIRAAVAKLNCEDHTLLCARIFKRLSWQEIGEALSEPGDLPLSPGTARQRGSRALKKLRQHYETIREEVRLPDDPTE